MDIQGPGAHGGLTKLCSHSWAGSPADTCAEKAIWFMPCGIYLCRKEKKALILHKANFIRSGFTERGNYNSVMLDIGEVAGCGKAWLGTLEVLVGDDREGSTYNIGTGTATSVKNEF